MKRSAGAVNRYGNGWWHLLRVKGGGVDAIAASAVTAEVATGEIAEQKDGLGYLLRPLQDQGP